MPNNNNSERITILRPLLILLIVTTHVQGNLYRIDLQDVPLQFDNFIHALLSGAVASSALPLLSIIAGYLAGHTFTRKPYGSSILTKVDRILMPMLAWNFLAAVYVLWEQGKGLPSRQDIPLLSGGMEIWFYALTGFLRVPANPPLYFLRELFICFLFAPLFLQLVRSRLLFAAFFLFVAVCAVKNINFGFFQRIDIYGFFVLGLFLYRQQGTFENTTLLQRKWFQLGWLLLFMVLACALTVYGFQDRPEHFLQLRKGLTLVGPLAFWIVSGYVGGWFKQLLLWLSPASFMVFLGHSAFLALYWQAWILLFKSSPLTRYYGAYWVSAVLLSMLSMFVLRWLWVGYLHRATK